MQKMDVSSWGSFFTQGFYHLGFYIYGNYHMCVTFVDGGMGSMFEMNEPQLQVQLA